MIVCEQIRQTLCPPHTLCSLTGFVLLATAITGCGGSATPPAAPGNASTANSTAPVENTTATANSPGAPANAENSNAPRRQNERWTDANGVEYLGNVPLDVFFDQPYQVAADMTPLSGAATPGGVSPAVGGMSGGGPPALAATNTAATESTGAAETTAAPPAAAGGNDDWATLISGKVLDEEVTSTRNFLKSAVQAVGSYNSSMLMIPPKAATLAALANIAANHPEAVSWQEDAAYVRNLAGKMNESTLQRGSKDQKRLLLLFENIADILNRSKPAGLEEPSADETFSDVAEMRLLMMRMESAEKKMKNEAGSETSFASQKDTVLHEAAILGTLTRVVTTEGYGYADDDEFKGYAQKIIDATKEISTAAETSNFGAYELALSKISSSCQECHSAYKNN